MTFIPKRTPFAYFLLLLFVFGCAKEENTTYSIRISTAPSEGGQVSPANVSSIDEGQRITFTASANEGYAFNGWEGTLNENTNPLTLVGNKDYQLMANFRALPQLTDEVLVYDYNRIDTFPFY